MADFARSYGPLFSLRLGTQTLIVGSSAAAAKEILSSYDRIFCARYVPGVMPEKSSEFYNNSIVWSLECDDRWKYLRTMCRTQLFSGKAIESQACLREKKLMEVVGFLSSMEDLVSLEDETAVARMLGCVKKTVDVMSTPNLADYYPILRGLDLQRLQKKSRDSFVELFSLWQPIVKERRERKGSHATRQHDFLDALINDGFTDDRINFLLGVNYVIHVVGTLHKNCRPIGSDFLFKLRSDDVWQELLIAGTESTSVTTEWAMAELIRSPDSMKKIREELTTEINKSTLKDSDLRKLPYLQACLKETLRLHPPGPFLLPHRALESCKVMNYTIPKDAQRFLNSIVDFQGTNFEFIPFGAGRRICPGLPMAVKLIPPVLVSWIHFFDWSLPNWGDPKEIDMRESLVPIYRRNILYFSFLKLENGHKFVPNSCTAFAA
ncbi:Corytuberine synthase [Vitis vinifera]|uniref:Corytuberine synthase n=1 Tax=Vitis vinifera TaxID=29760 RepID=A0A438BZL6_VITVI|nr:Corytuberine synthase [Vitis vinifera]